MKDYKVYCKDEETVEKLLDKAEKLGYNTGELNEIAHIIYFLYLHKEGYVEWDTYGFSNFKNYNHKELTPEEFLKLTPDDGQEKREFDIKPDQLVLCRGYNDGQPWRLNRFSHIEDGWFIVYGLCYACIAPYEGNESYLGTKSNIPGSWHIDEVVK